MEILEMFFFSVAATNSQADKEFFLPFRCFCTRKDVSLSSCLLQFFILPQIPCLSKFKAPDVPSSVTKGAPEFCTIYIISKGKISSLRSASASVPNQAPRMQLQPPSSAIQNHMDARFMQGNNARGLTPS